MFPNAAKVGYIPNSAQYMFSGGDIGTPPLCQNLHNIEFTLYNYVQDR